MDRNKNPKSKKRDDDDEAPETEITAEIFVPPDGGWGWVVVLASFYCTFLLDGIFFTFGSIYKDMTDDLGIDGTLVAFLNSVTIALYLMCGPLVAALVNRFGFRACSMVGSIIISVAFLCTYFSTHYVALLFFYGIASGFGGCLVLIPSTVIIGFYFERYRAMAMALAGLGSSSGVMIIFSMNSFIVKLAGWRVVILIQSGLFGSMYFVGMAYRPVTVLTFTQTTDTDNDAITYVKSLSRAVMSTKIKGEGVTPTATERLFSAVSSPNFPTAYTVAQEGNMSRSRAGPSNLGTSKLTISVRNLAGTASRKQLQTLATRINTDKENMEITFPTEKAKDPKRKWWSKFCCKWHKHVKESRPMYRDDAFYAGKIQNLSVYQKSVAAIHPDERTGLEYQMAVSRVMSVTDLEEKKGVCTTSLRRVLATMMDPQLLKRCSFLLLCLSAIFIFIGLLTPYVFLKDRAKSEGIPDAHAEFFVSAIGFFNSVGRLVAGGMATKYNPCILYLTSCILSGVGSICYNFCFDVIYQYFCCVIFGIFISAITGLRSLVLVDCYGLDKLTNSTGMMLMAQGIGSLISSPLSNVLRATFDYAVAFYASGTVLIISGLVLLPVNRLVARENKRLGIET